MPSLADSHADSDTDARLHNAASALADEANALGVTVETLAAHVHRQRAKRSAPTVLTDEQVKGAINRALAKVERDDDAIDLALAAAAVSEFERHAVDLGAIIREGIPPVEYMPGEFARGMVYTAGVTVFAGKPDSGKTSLVSRLAVDAMRHGRTVVYLDYENGYEEVARRFAALGADAALLSERLVYLPFPGAPDWEALEALWDRYPDAIGVWDSTRGILGSLGLKENEADDVRQFFDPLVRFSLERRIPSLVIDHVTKASTSDDPYSRGSGDKLAAVQGQWRVTKVSEFDESHTGEIELSRKKARSGRLHYQFRFAVGDGEGGLTFRRLDPDESPEGRMDTAIIAHLRVLHAEGETASMNDLENAITGGREKVRARVKTLADHDRPVKAITDGGRFTRYAYDPDADKEPSHGLGF